MTEHDQSSTAIVSTDERIEKFAHDVARYVTSHRGWAEMSKEEAAREAIRVAFTAPGAIEEAIACLAPQNGRSTDV